MRKECEQFQMNEDKMQQDSDVRVQHLKIFREFGGFLVYKKTRQMRNQNIKFSLEIMDVSSGRLESKGTIYLIMSTGGLWCYYAVSCQNADRF